MLVHLHIINFAIVAHLDLEFDSGMTVITGETGAGKSIMLDALGLTLGDRADTSILADGQDKAEIHATFDLTDNVDAQTWLVERELSNNDSMECILRRIITKDGRSRAYINSQPCTVQDLKLLGELLIDIHLQHEHQSLLKKETHRRLLDNFGGLEKIVQQVGQIYAALKTAENELAELKKVTGEQSSRLQLLTYQASELSDLNMREDEHIKLAVEQKRLAGAESSLENCQQVLEILTDSGDSRASIADSLARGIRHLEEIDDPQLHGIIDLLNSSRIQLEEAGIDLHNFTEEFQIDPQRLQEVEDRLGRIYEIARKHHIDAAEIPQVEHHILTELSNLENVDTRLDEVTNLIEELRTQYLQAATTLSKKRAASAKKLATQVSARLKKLGMSDTEFAVNLVPLKNPFGRHGQEDIEFLISTIAGQSKKALNKIASGGELSRISLAIQVVTASTTKAPTLVFDEVDVGIGGGIAEVVGAMLRQLGSQGQILCVTHLPQVAAQGHQHLLVSRLSQDDITLTEITRLITVDKVSEIARMLGGIELTAQSMAHAREMFETAQRD
ncbi:MAG: DNA repair protein RecN [Gammaproteobacteria bacterium]|nr:DNA repair protein RecN [Gammaproteobacteria bacterium]